MIAIISLNIPAEKRGSILHDLSADEPGVCRRTFYGVSSRTQRTSARRILGFCDVVVRRAVDLCGERWTNDGKGHGLT